MVNKTNSSVDKNTRMNTTQFDPKAEAQDIIDWYQTNRNTNNTQIRLLENNGSKKRSKISNLIKASLNKTTGHL